ncbi:hypothetical protein [Thermococcus sp.]
MEKEFKIGAIIGAFIVQVIMFVLVYIILMRVSNLDEFILGVGLWSIIVIVIGLIPIFRLRKVLPMSEHLKVDFNIVYTMWSSLVAMIILYSGYLYLLSGVSSQESSVGPMASLMALLVPLMLVNSLLWGLSRD